MKLKYGMNPNQKDAEVILNNHLNVLSGNPSIINMLDGLNAWPLVKELHKAVGISSAASFKHVTPSGAAIGNALGSGESDSCNYTNSMDEPLTRAYLKARGADRLASFGDFIALSDTVTTETARLIRSEVSDGIIAPSYTDDALNILKEKKKGNFCILEIDRDYEPPLKESREVYGFKLTQDRNTIAINRDCLRNIKTSPKVIPEQILQNLIIGMITLKYTQSNSLAVIQNGQVVGIGSGQQSRILCSELALSKANRWYQKVQLDYTRLEYPELNMTRTEKDLFHDQMRIREFGERIVLNNIDDLCLCSDGFFPQVDNIELAYKYGVKYIASPMGSIKDPDILDACEKYGITFIDTGVRLFHH